MDQLGVNHMGHFVLCGLLYERVEACAGRDLAEHALDREASARLWQVSEEGTGLRWSP